MSEASHPTPTDQQGRKLRDLRISVTDRCNFRCGYCMPADVFGADYGFLPKGEILSFEELERLARLSVPLGVRKVRLTGGEPLLRRGLPDLVAMLAAIEGIEDIALTTNGILLAHHAEALALAGLNRVTVSLDALDPAIFARMSGVGAKVERVLAGISAAQTFGLQVKVNCVVQRDVNESQILPLVDWACGRNIIPRFIEFMDVGETNSWSHDRVASAATILEVIESRHPLTPLSPAHPGETASRWGLKDGKGEIGVISSVTQPFCGNCSRLRLSADGRLFTCLFATAGHHLKPMLRGGASDSLLQAALSGVWTERTDRYSEIRGSATQPKAEMSYLGG